MATSAQQLAELERRRQLGELSRFPLDPNFLFQLNESGQPLRRSDLDHETGLQAVVLTRAELQTLGAITFMHSSGEEMTIEAASMRDHTLVIFPEEVG